MPSILAAMGAGANGVLNGLAIAHSLNPTGPVTHKVIARSEGNELAVKVMALAPAAVSNSKPVVLDTTFPNPQSMNRTVECLDFAHSTLILRLLPTARSAHVAIVWAVLNVSGGKMPENPDVLPHRQPAVRVYSEPHY